jgi:hypothetical protein
MNLAAVGPVKRNSVSALVVVFVLTLAIVVDALLGQWKQEEKIITHDARSYYGYLPAYFIFDDLKVEKSDYQYDEGLYWLWTVPTQKGKKVFKMNCGVALMQTPFFFLGHQAAKLLDYPITGFSLPYRVFMLIGALFWFITGIWLLRSSLLKLGFSDPVTALTLFIIGAGTNVFFYATADPLMSHVYSFTLLSLSLYSLLRFIEAFNWKFLIVLSIAFGLLTLVRLSNAAFFLFIALVMWPVRDRLTMKKCILWCALLLLGFVIAWIPQIAYWKAVAGEYFVYSYGTEGFFFLDPMLKEGLVGFRRGWFIYTPLMLFAVLGFFIKSKRLEGLRAAVILFTCIHFYIVVSWWCWWYGGSYGQRAMIDVYPVLALPLALCIERVQEFRKLFRWPVYLLIGMLIALNLFQEFQYVHGGLHHDSMTAKAYRHQFGYLEKQPGVDSLLVYPNYGEALNGDR